MHNLNVLILGPTSFCSTLNELKPFLKFNPHFEISDVDYDVILFHKEALKDNHSKDYIDNSSSLKVCAQNKAERTLLFEANLELPTSVTEINYIIENLSAKKVFIRNSSIKIKSYQLNKNEKKLIKENHFIILTEKEIQLLELLLAQKKPINKNDILSTVWNYSSDADTHTVETHIYRLRKKINDEFSDETFILNNKNGYHL